MIYSNKATYQRNDEIVYTEGNSKAIDNENREITAEKITYKKIPNTFEAKGKVKIEDTTNNYVIYSKKLIYFKNEEKIITKGSTEADLQSEYNIKSENVEFKLDSRQLSSKVKSVLTDNNNQIYYLDEFKFYLDQDLLKGKGILTITNYNLPNSDKFYFSDGIFNLKNKKFVAKKLR